MNMSQKPDSRTRDSLAPTMADMLTVSLQESKALINSVTLYEASKLLGAFSTSVVDYGKSARKWRAHTLSRLPIDCWKCADGFFYVEPLKEASLKYMSATAPEDADASAWNQLENRRALHKALVEVLPADMRQTYAEMLEWTQIEPQSQTQPVLEDMALARTVYALDHLFYREYAACEDELRRQENFPERDSIPFEWMGWLADKAVQKVNAHLFIWGALPLPWLDKDLPEDDPVDVPTPCQPPHKPEGELTLELLCNVVGNRALLESARIGDLAEAAARVSVDLLSALNRQQVVNIPELRSCDDLRDTLKQCFGDQGVLAHEPGFEMPLKGDNLEVVLYHTFEVQQHYVKTRGSIAPDSHRNPENSFMFALAMVACFYGRISLDKEFSGSTYPTYAVFPAQNKQQGLAYRFKPLAPHARELIKSIYGQIFFANTGWEIRAEAITTYAEGLALKRSCLQELTFNTFKRTAPHLLLKLHQAFSRMAERKKADCLQGLPQGSSPPSEMACIQLAIDDLFA